MQIQKHQRQPRGVLCTWRGPTHTKVAKACLPHWFGDSGGWRVGLGVDRVGVCLSSWHEIKSDFGIFLQSLRFVIRHGQVSHDRWTFDGVSCHPYQTEDNGNWCGFFPKHFEVKFIFLLHSGFPPGDYEVSKFLVHAPFTPDDASHRAQAFLISLCETTAKIWIISSDKILLPWTVRLSLLRDLDYLWPLVKDTHNLGDCERTFTMR